MMRDLLAGERTLLYSGQCPHCRGLRLVAGPRGGASQNFYCEDCGAGFNRIAPEFIDKFGLRDKVPPFGQLIQQATRKPS